MNVVERLTEALAQAGCRKGYRKPVYGPKGRLDHQAKQLIEVLAGDIAQACELVEGQTDPTVKDLREAAKWLKPEEKVVLEADHLFHLLSQVTAKG